MSLAEVMVYATIVMVIAIVADLVDAARVSSSSSSLSVSSSSKRVVGSVGGGGRSSPKSGAALVTVAVIAAAAAADGDVGDIGDGEVVPDGVRVHVAIVPSTVLVVVIDGLEGHHPMSRIFDLSAERRAGVGRRARSGNGQELPYSVHGPMEPREIVVDVANGVGHRVMREVRKNLELQLLRGEVQFFHGLAEFEVL